MGNLADFYTGDTERIHLLLVASGTSALEDNDCVVSRADLSYNLNRENFESLVTIACQLVGQTPFTFQGSIKKTLKLSPPDNPEMGIHVMSMEFIVLFASIPLAKQNELFKIWIDTMPDDRMPPVRSRLQKFIGTLQVKLTQAIITIVVMPMIWAMWLFSPEFRKDRKQNIQMRINERKLMKVLPEYTLRDALAALIATCKTAKSNGTDVIYMWSI